MENGLFKQTMVNFWQDAITVLQVEQKPTLLLFTVPIRMMHLHNGILLTFFVLPYKQIMDFIYQDVAGVDGQVILTQLVFIKQLQTIYGHNGIYK